MPKPLNGKRTTSNKKLDSVLVWRIKQMIIDHQWSPEQIRGVLAKEGVSVSIQTIYNIINADESGELRRHRRHPDFRRRPKCERKPTKSQPTYQTAQQYTTDRPRPTANALAILRWILLLKPTGTRFQHWCLNA